MAITEKTSSAVIWMMLIDHVHAGGAGHAAEGDVGDAEREHDAEEVHEQRAVVAAAERVREELVQQIAAQKRGHADHAARDRPSSRGGSPSR